MNNTKNKILKLAEEGPKNEDRITVGLATCGISAGGMDVFKTLKKAKLKVPILSVGCNGMCYNEPIVTVIKDGKKTIYKKVTSKNVQKLIDSIKKNNVCEELFCCNELKELDFYKKQKRLVMENCGDVKPLIIEDYYRHGGFTGLINAVNVKPEKVIEKVLNSGLRGRGGAGFPTGLKWKFVAGAKGEKYLICNGDEGDPGSFMNRTLMESDPFKVIEGMIIGAYATNITNGIIYTRAEYPLAIETLQKAITICRDEDLLGKDILGIKGFDFDLIIKIGAGAFVCGEETALIESIEGKRGSPRIKPPFPAQKGVYGKPSNVNNVGTFGHVATILRIGETEYAKIGLKHSKSKGTKIVCLTGKVQRSGVLEVPMGTSLKVIVNEIGGGVPTGTKLKAVQSGGPAGGCIPANKLNTPLDYEPIMELGAIMGSGGLVVINDDSCMVDVARYFMNFSREESCGKCTPCREGTTRLYEMLDRITNGKAKKEDIALIEKLSNFVKDNALCGLGMAAPNPILSTLKYFKKEYNDHLNGHCTAKICKNLMNYKIVTKNCIGCHVCSIHCPAKAIKGEAKEKHEIIQDKCTKCGACYDTCPVKAIIKE